MRTKFVTKMWKVVAEGLDGRFHDVVVDRQIDYEHCRHLAEAFATPENPEGATEEERGHIPRVEILREGSDIALLDALQALMELVPNNTDAYIQAADALDQALNPSYDIEYKEDDKYGLDDIAEAGKRGGQCFLDGGTRANCPDEFNPGSIVYDAWFRGFDAEMLQADNIADAEETQFRADP